ncbi:MAG: hypothetical protein RQ724_06830 [Desulfuromonadales bacterium]|nr:hypothetical protein [Desulfuromonadales bacterium]
MNNKIDEQQWQREFTDFVNASPQHPSAVTDAAVQEQITTSLHRWQWSVYARLSLVQLASGLATLILCPQFGLGFGAPLLAHAHHDQLPPLIFYFICGLLFVSLGALLGGLLLPRHALAQLTRRRFRFCCVYALVVYLVLIGLGSDAFVVASLSWIMGATWGNSIGLSLIDHLRQPTT